MVVGNPLNEDDLGNFQPRAFNDAKMEWERLMGSDPDILKYVEDRLRFGKGLPSELEALETAKELLSDYWNIHNTTFGEGSTEAGIIEDYLARGSSRNKSLYLQNNPYARNVVDRWEKARERYRSTHPEEDWALVRFYDASPRTSYSVGKLNDAQNGLTR